MMQNGTAAAVYNVFSSSCGRVFSRQHAAAMHDRQQALVQFIVIGTGQLLAAHLLQRLHA